MLAESLQPPGMGTFYHAQACTSEGCVSAETLLCKDPGVMGPDPNIFLVVQAWSLPTNNPPPSENETRLLRSCELFWFQSDCCG